MIKAAPMGTRTQKPLSVLVTGGRSAKLPNKPKVNAVLPNGQGTVVTKPYTPPKVKTLADELDDIFAEPTPVKAVERAVAPIPTKQATLPAAPANNTHPRTAKCVLCHTLMSMTALRPADFGGYQCLSIKGCKERKGMNEVVEGGKQLAAAITPKVSAVAKLTGSTPNGMRITQPSAKEIAHAKLDSMSGYIRITDEEEPLDITPKPAETAQPVKVSDDPPRSDEEIARDVLYNVVDKQGIKWTLCEALQIEGINSVPAHLIAVIADEALENGELPYGGMCTLLEKIAKAARAQGHAGLAFFIAQAYFNETGKRFAGF